MASIVLTAAGAALGNATGLAGAAALGGKFGRLIGGFVDDAVFGGTKLKDREGPRLEDLAVQSSAYGRMIPIVYGTVRIAGNIIWSRPIQETANTTTSSASAGGGKGGGGRVTQTSTTYSYSVSMAIGICEGEITEVLRVWADAKLLDLSQYTIRIYTGSETQAPDSYMQAFAGGQTPAHRGLAYMVVEDFPLADYGNRIPNFTFEVKKKALNADYNGETAEEMVKSITLIPGAGEFVYDTQVQVKISGEEISGSFAQTGNRTALNMHNATGSTNVLLSLDQLAETLPNVEWVSVVCSWFGDTIDTDTCLIKPGVEYASGGQTTPETWSVSTYDRSTARAITYEDGSPRYGGTPDDQSIIRLLTELNNRGYNVMFYPMLFMDVDGKPWRGTLTGSAAGIPDFFSQTYGYNDFIIHYASLTKDYIDAFVIGSELKALTAVTDAPGSYPAVDELVSLAASVKTIVGSGVKVTYAADWSEYHHDDNGYYHLDPLWASSNIDMVGIDAYFPLTDEVQSGYDVQDAIDGWTSGEGYDFYYTDVGRTTTASLSAPYAWKNLAWWWSNTHTNPGGATTSWVAESKPIWFTEYGFPSVDGATNQPNVFYDLSTASSAFPYHSRGRIDFRAQRTGIVATEAQWKDSTMVERMFLWTWDARPYPYWPDLASIWSDGAAWKTGHWVQGKLGISGLGAIIEDLCLRAGLASTDFIISGISDRVEGYILTSQTTIRAAIEQLQQAFFFDAAETGEALTFAPRGALSVDSVSEADLVPQVKDDARELLTITRKQEIELPKRVNIVYLNRLSNYQPATQYAERQVTDSREISTRNFSIVLPDQQARVIADISLFAAWTGRTSYRFRLPVAYAHLEPADVVTLTEENGQEHVMRLTQIRFAAPNVLEVEAIAEDASSYDFYTEAAESLTGTSEVIAPPATQLEMLDIPLLPKDPVDQARVRIAANGLSEGWRGAVLYRSDDGGLSYEPLSDLTSASIIGTALTALPDGATQVFDYTNEITVSLLGEGELYSTTELAVLNGANACLIGNEIVQFTTATLVSTGKYTLSGLLRGRLGTEHETGNHTAGERFVLLNALVASQEVPRALFNLSREYKPVSVGTTLAATTAESFTYNAIALKPYAPVHVTGERDGSGNLTISWVRRTRGGGDWKDGVDAPLNEASEAYEVDILDGSDVVRTLTSTTPTATYSAADQTTDFGGTESSVEVRIYQLSAIVGRGVAAEADI